MENLLTVEEIGKTRSPKELAEWVRQIVEVLMNSADASRAYRTRKRLPAGDLYKQFAEEVYPLYLFTDAVYRDYPEVTVTPNIGNDNFDAVIREGSSAIKVEITAAVDGKDLHRKMKYLNEHGGVFLTGDIREEETTTPRMLVNSPKAVDHSQVVDQQLNLMLDCANKKAAKTYGKGYFLLISFDAFPFMDENYRSDLKNWAEQHLMFLIPGFRGVYLVGSLGTGGIVLHVTETGVIEVKHGTVHG